MVRRCGYAATGRHGLIIGNIPFRRSSSHVPTGLGCANIQNLAVLCRGACNIVPGFHITKECNRTGICYRGYVAIFCLDRSGYQHSRIFRLQRYAMLGIHVVYIRRPIPIRVF